jgi:cobalt/nickel transport system permease protein
MCYRYIYLFVGIIENTYLAIKSRVGSVVHYKKGQRIVALKIATLWQRSYQLNEEVYNAMLSRGYTGEARLLEEFKVGVKDWAWLFCATVISILLVYAGYIIKT